MTAPDFFANIIAILEREPQDVELDFDGDIPMKGQTIDGATYEIRPGPLFGGYTVWVTSPVSETLEASDLVFKGSLNECKNYVYWNMEVQE